MRISSLLAMIVVCFVLASSVAEAHSGHGSGAVASDPHSMTHYMTEPVHVVGIVGAVSVIVASGIVVTKCWNAARP